MVLLHVKRGDESQFLYETSTGIGIEQLAYELVTIYNGRLKVSRVCSEIEELAKHGTMLPPDMLGLTDEQVEELHLVDEWADKCIPSGGWRFNRDPVGRRNGRQPQLKMGEVLTKAIEDAKAMISKKLTTDNKTLTQRIVQDALDLLRGAVTIVYPMQLPPHDPIRMEFSNTEDLTGTQASLEVIEPSKVQLWFAGKMMQTDKRLGEIVGANEKTKIIVKLAKLNEGAPGREPVITEDAKKQMMLHAYRRQEELKLKDDDALKPDRVLMADVYDLMLIRNWCPPWGRPDSSHSHNAKRFPSAAIYLPVLFSKLGTVHPWWIPATFGVDEKLCIHHIPLDAVEISRMFVPFVKCYLGVVNQQLMTPDGSGRATFPARAPGTVAHTFRVHMIRHNARHRYGIVICHNRRYGGIHHKRYQKEKCKYRQDSRGA
uniref:Uncharacterized protein n=1 Tax=Anopheles culicifacies TaxID=139723 RepID=A0A182MDV6_9DIPT